MSDAPFSMTIRDLVRESYENARDHGFWDGPEQDNTPSKIALMHSELSEVLESFRDPVSDYMVKVPVDVVEALLDPADVESQDPDELNRAMRNLDAHTQLAAIYEKWTAKPKGLDIEVADVLIRIFDFIGARHIDIEDALRRKIVYNKGRERMHGRRV